MDSIYIVHRDSADGPESDVFTDVELAEEWAEHIGSTVTHEYPIDRLTLEMMKESYGNSEEGNSPDDNISPEEITE